MPELRGLPGVSARSLPALGFRTADQGYRKVRTGIGLIAAGNHGSISVWIDDDGLYRAEFDRFLVTKAVFISAKKVDLRNWLREWIPRMDHAK